MVDHLACVLGGGVHRHTARADACAEYLKNCEYKEFFVSGIYNVLAAQGARIVGFACDLHLPFGTPDEYRTAEAPANKAGFDALT